MHASLLKQFNAIQKLTDEECELVKSKFDPVFYEKKGKLLDQEEISGHFFFINEGLVRLYGFKEGENKTLFFFREGMLAGAIQSYLSEQPSRLVLEALEPTQALKISKEGLDDLFNSSHSLVKIGLVLSQLRLQQLLIYFSSFVLDSPEERYEKLVENDQELVNRVPQHLIASFIGITPVSLSRIRKRMTGKH